MKIPVFTTSILAVGLLFSTSGCSKKQDPSAQSPTNIGSYQYNGNLKSCTAKATFDNSSGPSLLVIELTSSPQPATGSEALKLLFEKNKTQSASDYTLVQIQQFLGGVWTFIAYPDSFTITSTSGGGFSGTFSSVSRFSNPAITPINFTNGVFTDVRP
jgi:hypothetical protein